MREEAPPAPQLPSPGQMMIGGGATAEVAWDGEDTPEISTLPSGEEIWQRAYGEHPDLSFYGPSPTRDQLDGNPFLQHAHERHVEATLAQIAAAPPATGTG